MNKIVVLIVAILLISNQVGQVVRWVRVDGGLDLSSLIGISAFVLFDVIIGMAIIDGVE